MGKNRGNGSCQATTSRDRLKFISTRRDSSVTAPTLTVGQVLDGTAQENTSVGKMSRTARVYRTGNRRKRELVFPDV